MYQSDLTPQAMAGWFTPTPAAQEALDGFEAVETESLLPAETAVDIESTPREEHTPSLNPVKTESKRYYIVVGSFKMENNALNLAEELQGQGQVVKVPRACISFLAHAPQTRCLFHPHVFSVAPCTIQPRRRPKSS